MDDYLQGILRNFKFANWHQADRVLKKHYETTFGVLDHSAETVRRGRPWSGMAALPGNTPGPHYVHRYLIREYHDAGVKDILDMSFEKFIELPPYEMKQVKDECRRIRQQKERDEAAKDAQMKALLSDAKAGKGPKPISGMIT